MLRPEAGKLQLRRATVLRVLAERAGWSELEIALDDCDSGPRRAALDAGLLGAAAVGDELIVNVAAVELGLGSGGRDIVVVNLTRGLTAATTADEHVMKLNYSPLQHAVAPIEAERFDRAELAGMPVAVFQLHAQLPCIAWAAEQRRPELRLGYVQTAGGALPGAMSQVTCDLIAAGLLTDHVTAAPCYGGVHEAISLAGALAAGFGTLGWDAAVVGPGPGILGSASALGHGGMQALDSLHAALALGCEPIFAIRASSADERPRHRGISHHSRTVLELLLQPVTIALAAGAPEAPEFERHRVERRDVDADRYAGSGLPAVTMGRNLGQDRVFFEQALAAGVVLAERA